MCIYVSIWTHSLQRRVNTEGTQYIARVLVLWSGLEENMELESRLAASFLGPLCHVQVFAEAEAQLCLF